MKHRNNYKSPKAHKVRCREPYSCFYVFMSHRLSHSTCERQTKDLAKKNRTSKKLMRFKKQLDKKNKYLKINTVKSFVKILIKTYS